MGQWRSPVMAGPRATRLVLARHGESEANVVGEFSNRGMKHPLTARGRAQASELAQRLAGAGIDRILSSPVLRARQTAEIVADALVRPVVVDERLREFDVGEYEGSRDPAHWSEYDDVMSSWLELGDLDGRVGGGESRREMLERMASLLDDAYAMPGTTLLLGHGGLFLCTLPFLLDGLPAAWARARPLAPTSTVDVEPEGAGLVCVAWDGALPPR